MPFSLAVAGTNLKVIFPDGTVVDVTLPANASVVSGQRARFAIFERNVIVVNATSIPVWMDADGVVRPLAIPSPHAAPTVAAGGVGALTGTFRVKVAYVVKDNLGATLAEGPRGPASQIVTVAAQQISMTAIPISTDASVNCRRFYRTATGPGTEYFEWIDLDDNITTAFSDDALDADLSILAAPDDHGSAPGKLTLIAEWKGRLWGKTPGEIDVARYSADGKHYGWPETNALQIQPIGKDTLGITAFIPRRDELAIARRDMIWKVIGSSDDDFRLVKLIEGKGVLAPDSVVVARDVARWLADDGVYEWDSEGVRCISDAKVHPWFNTDTYFDRSQFRNAFARYDPLKNSYDLFLVPTGGTTFTRWVSFDISRKAWLGPHLTDAFTPTAAGVLFDAGEVLVPAVCGSDGYVYQVTPGNYADGPSTGVGIAFDVTSKFHSGGAPDITHYWGEIAILTHKETTGVLTITPKVGRLDASAQAAISHDLTLGRQRLRRPGVGALCQLRFQESTANQPLAIYGYELPYHEVGRR